MPALWVPAPGDDSGTGRVRLSVVSYPATNLCVLSAICPLLESVVAARLSGPESGGRGDIS